jgi:serine/threonine-protein kinase
MPLSESDTQSVRRQLDRVLASPGFARNERLSRFLRFVVARHLDDRNQELKESLIAIEIFGRSPDYDPKRDPIVRTEAGRLRARLNEYYIGTGKCDPLVIELPKGGYVPAFRHLDPPNQSASGRRRAPSSRHWLAPALISLGLIVAAVGWWALDSRRVAIPIAVLPLSYVSADLDGDYVADGLTQEIIRNLAVIDNLAVRSRTSSFFFKGKPRNIREAGKQLAADYLVEGSVQRSGRRLRVTVQLVRVRDDLAVWAARFDRELTDLFAIQDEISRGIVNSLRLKLGHGRRRYEPSAEAYDLYLRGRTQHLRGGISGENQSIALFQAAIVKDPSFAPAYAGLAQAFSFRAGTIGFKRADELAKMRAAAEKAIELDPLLADAYDALGVAYAGDGQWEQSELCFRRAIELDPKNPISYGQFAMHLLLVLGRVPEALRQTRIAEALDALSPRTQFNLAWVLLSAGRYDEAAGYCQKLPADHSFKSDCLGRARLGQGRIGEAIQILATAYDRGFQGYCYARAGRPVEAEKLLDILSPNPFNEAVIYAGLGNQERALEALERMAPLGAARVGRALTFPELALVRGHPRVQALRKEVGLPH